MWLHSHNCQEPVTFLKRLLIKDIVVKIAKIYNQELHVKKLNFAPFNNAV